MFPFLSTDLPDQFYRLFTSLCLHAGLLHLAITVAFQHIFLADLERLVGPVRTAIIYIGSGVAGNLISALLVPYKTEVGVDSNSSYLSTVYINHYRFIAGWTIVIPCRCDILVEHHADVLPLETVEEAASGADQDAAHHDHAVRYRHTTVATEFRRTHSWICVWCFIDPYHCTIPHNRQIFKKEQSKHS